MKHNLSDYYIGFMICSFTILLIISTVCMFAYLLFNHLVIVISIGFIFWMYFNIWFAFKLYKEYK